jgi:hypothetical protein
MGATLTRQDRRAQMDGKQTAPKGLWRANRCIGTHTQISITQALEMAEARVAGTLHVEVKPVINL